MCVGFHGHNTINSQLADVKVRRARMNAGSDSCCSGCSPNSTWSLEAGRGDERQCLLVMFSHSPFSPKPSTEPHNHNTYVSLVICIVSRALDSWGTIMNSHVAGGTLCWQFTSPDCKIFYLFSLKCQGHVFGFHSFQHLWNTFSIMLQ